MTEQTYDAIVIGSGVCGAMVACHLLERRPGSRLLVLEAGPEPGLRSQRVEDYILAPKKDMGAPYRSLPASPWAESPNGKHDYYVQDNLNPFHATYRRMEGGSTWHWRGNVPRWLPVDFELNKMYGVGRDWPFGYDELERWYTRAEYEMGVSGAVTEWDARVGITRSAPFPMSEIWPSYGDELVGRILDEDDFVYEGIRPRVRSTPQARNSRPYAGRPACSGNSTCDPVCPISAKYDATVHVNRAEERGAEIRRRSVVVRIDVDGFGAVRGVTYRTWGGESVSVTAPIVVLAAHAIENAMILLRSGISNSSDQVGRNLMDHLQGQGAALLPFPIFPYRGPPTTSGIDDFRDGDFRSRHSAFRMSIGNDGWGRVRGPYGTLASLLGEGDAPPPLGAALLEQLKDTATRQLRFSYSTEMLPNPENRVQVVQAQDGIGKPRLTFAVDEYSRRAFRYARGAISALFEALGAGPVTFGPSHTEGNDGAFSSANHIIGTTRMGNDPDQSVVDAWGQSHDNRGLYVVGSSVFPTSGTANPTLTAVALALRTAEHLAPQLLGSLEGQYA